MRVGDGLGIHREFALSVLESQDDLVTRHFTVDRTYFLIVNPAMTGRMQLVEVNIAFLTVKRVDRLYGK
jgi:hypothetical protein